MRCFEDPLLRNIVALAMLALVSAGDFLSLTALEITACIHNIPHDFSVAWQKILTTNSIADFTFACARGYGLDPSSLLKVRVIFTKYDIDMIVTFGEERQTEGSCKVLSAPRCYKAKIGMQDRVRVNSLVAERDKRFGDACKAGDTIVSYFVKGTINKGHVTNLRMLRLYKIRRHSGE
jgi:hypothetical protein